PPSNFTIGPLGPRLVAEERHDGFSLVRRAEPQSGICTASEKNRIISTAMVDLALDFVLSGLVSSVGLQAMKSVGDLKGTVAVAEHIDGRELIAGPDRLRIFLDDLLGRPGDALLNGRIDRDRCQRNAAQFRRRLEFAYLVLFDIRSIRQALV